MNIHQFIEAISAKTDDGYIHMEANRSGFWVMYTHRGIKVCKQIDYGRYPLWGGCANQLTLFEQLHKLLDLVPDASSVDSSSFDLDEFFGDYAITPEEMVMRMFEYPEDFLGETWTVIPAHEWDKLYRAALVALKSQNPIVYLSVEDDSAFVTAMSPSCQYNAALIIDKSDPVQLVLPARAIALFEASDEVTIQTTSSEVYMSDSGMAILTSKPEEPFRTFPDFPTGKNEMLWFERDTLTDAVDRATAYITAKGHGIWLQKPDCNQIRLWCNKPGGLLHIAGEKYTSLRPVERYGEYESNVMDVCGVALLDVLNSLSSPMVGLSLPALCKKEALIINSGGDSTYFLMGITKDTTSAELYNLNKALGKWDFLENKPSQMIIEQNAQYIIFAVEESPLEAHYPQWKAESNSLSLPSLKPEVILIDELSDLFDDFVEIIHRADDVPPDKRPPEFNKGVAILLEMHRELESVVNAPFQNVDDCLTVHYLKELRDRVIWTGGRMLNATLNLPETCRIEVAIRQ